MTTVALAAVTAGGAGAVARYVVDYAITQRLRGVVPWGTFRVNVSGSLALGLLTGLVLTGWASPEVQLVVGGGFLGAYTTFSTWMYETLRLVEQGARRAAAVNLGVSVASGWAAAWAGLWLTWLG